MGAHGPALVQSLSPAPPILSGDGEVITGTFSHSAGNVIDLHVEGLSQSIGTTDNHPFWSEDRQKFVPAGDLKTGERLRTEDGRLLAVAGATARRHAESVFNLEVNTEHVYYVSTTGVLVHNEYPDATWGLGEYLDDFVKRLDGSVERFPFLSLTDDADDLAGGLTHAMDRAGHNHFNFQGFNTSDYQAWRNSGGPGSLPFPGSGNVTNWELHQLFNNHLGNTTFYGAPGSDFLPWPF